MKTTAHNPDVLACLANLSNDEVFTPPDLANSLLDLLPASLWSNPDARFLDPVCKTGVFLREIAKRLIAGLAEKIPDLRERVDHICTKQLFGIAITELTAEMSRRSLYCSHVADGKYSVCTAFKNKEGNIRYVPLKHEWKDGHCVFCGASEAIYARGDSLESHAYEFIHTDHPERIFDMQFDVVIGNPPYQLSDGGAQASATPIYNRFVAQAIKLNPRYLTMIIPARWYGGGKGLDKFRDYMIKDKHIRELHDFPDASDCFGTGVEVKGGVCYFLLSRENKGKCKVVTHSGHQIVSAQERFLQEEGSDVFIRFSQGVDIYHKVYAFHEKKFDTLVSSQKPFGLRTFVHGKEEPFDGAVKLYENGGVGYVSEREITKNREWIKAPKVFISAAYNAGDTYPHQIIGKPIAGERGSCCTETYVVIGPFLSEKVVRNVISYISTRFFRFLVMLKKSSQHAAAVVYSFVPVQDFSRPWTDEELYGKYGLTKDEIAFIESMVRPMEVKEEKNERE
jgi:site-specific DNA-methyltransferase (adenine-specific)